MQEAITFAGTTQRVLQLVDSTLAELGALANFQPPSEAERRAMLERAERIDAEQHAYEAERLRRNPRLRYRSRRPLWWRLQHPVRGHPRPASLIRDSDGWCNY